MRVPTLLCSAVALVALGACGAGGASDPGPAPTPPSQSFKPASETNVIYGSGLTDNGAINLLLDIFQPDGACTELRPFVIGVHGGGFVTGNKGGNWTTNAQGLADRGIVGISINYRLAGDDPLVSADFQPLLDDLNEEADRLGVPPGGREILNAAVAAFEDAVTAIEWARDNAQNRCLDINRFGLWGSSAGAYSVLHTAYALDEYFIDVPEPSVVVDYWGALFLDGWIDGDEPPLLILHGNADATVAYQEALDLAAEATAAGLNHTFYTVDGGGHGFTITNPERVLINGKAPIEVTYDFIEAHLTGGTPLYETQTVPFGP